MVNSLTVKSASKSNKRGLRSDFIACESFLDSNSPDILPLCKTKLKDSIERLTSFNSKDSVPHMHVLAVYVKEGILFVRKLSLENSEDFYSCFRLALLHSVSYICFIYRSRTSCLSTVFDAISSKTDKVFSVNPSANAFVGGDFHIYHKDWLIYSGGDDRPGEQFPYPIPLSQTRRFTFLYGSLTVTLTVLLFGINFFLLTLVFSIQWLSLPWKTLII